MMPITSELVRVLAPLACIAGAQALVARGFQVGLRQCIEIAQTAAINNLGGAASSFGYLKTLLVDFLKIDGQFILDPRV